MTIGIIGGGYVGQAFGKMISDHYDYLIFDPYHPDYKGTTKKDINKCDLAVIAVPTPMDYSKGFPYSADTSIVEEAVSWVKTPLILIKSTVPVGTTERLSKKYKKRICFSPEYVGETKYWVSCKNNFRNDMKATPFLVIGGPTKEAEEIFDILIPILGPEKNYHHCTASEAEMIKYMENMYIGVKNIFANEMYEICKKLGLNWYNVWQGWGLDPRVDKMMTAVFPQARGFGGKCLPKDLNSLVRIAKDAGYTPKMLTAMLKSNLDFRGLKDYKDDPTVQKKIPDTPIL